VQFSENLEFILLCLENEVCNVCSLKYKFGWKLSVF